MTRERAGVMREDRGRQRASGRQARTGMTGYRVTGVMGVDPGHGGDGGGPGPPGVVVAPRSEPMAPASANRRGGVTTG